MIELQCIYGYCVSDIVFVPGLKVDFNFITDSTEANALGRENSYIDIYTNSWGPSDYGFSVERPGSLLQQTLTTGVREVRQLNQTSYL